MIGSYLCHFSQVPLHSSFDVEAPQPLFHIIHSIFQSVCSSLRYLPLLVLQPLFLFSSVVFDFLLQPPFLLYLRASPTSHEPSPYVLVDVLHFVDPQFEFLCCLFIFLLFLFLSPPSPLVYGYSPHSSSSSPPRVSSGMLVVARLPLDVVIASLYRRFPCDLLMMRVNLFVTFIC